MALGSLVGLCTGVTQTTDIREVLVSKSIVYIIRRTRSNGIKQWITNY